MRNKPKSQVEERRNAHDPRENKYRDEGYHPRPGIKEKISSQYSRDGTRGAQCRRQPVGGKECLKETRSYAPQQVEEQKAKLAQAVFDVVAEDCQGPHVADQVKPAAMQESRSNQRVMQEAA